MRKLMVVALSLASLAAVGGPAAKDQQKPVWRESGKMVAIFGEVDHPGFYKLEAQRITLANLAVIARVRHPKGGGIIVNRATENGTKTIQLDADRLKEDGDIPLEANDVVQVTPPKAA